MQTRDVETSSGRIAIAESAGTGLPVLAIHGNSSCKEVFRNQLDGSIGRSFRLVAIDLPGHGASADAADPEATYTMPGYAATAAEVMSSLDIDRYAVLGWSLGGHIGIELMASNDAVVGLLISGTPPIEATPDGMAAGFLPSEHMGLTGKRDFTDEDIDAYARATCGEPFEAFLRDAVARTDGRARETMIASVATGVGHDQKQAATGSRVPLAIVNGADEPFVNNDYVAGLTYDNLWDGQVHVIEGSGHAPFWEAADRFDPIVDRFLRSLG